MMVLSTEDRLFWLRLLGSGLDHTSLSQCLKQLSHPKDLFDVQEDFLVRQFGFNPKQLHRLRDSSLVKQAEKQLRLLDQHDIQLIPASDPRFPANLFKMQVPPVAVFMKGKIEPYDALAVGLVGPRKPTPYGLDVARRLSGDVASVLTVISGAAMGIDSAVHQAALDNGGRTIAVLGCGIDVDYPSGNRRLRERIATGEQGALLSIFPPGSQPKPHHFPARNTVLAGLSMAVVVIEASKKSGALVTARAAGEEGRYVYAVPGDINRTNSQGSNALLRDGASVCCSAEDLLSDLEPALQGELEHLKQRQREGVGGKSEAPEKQVFDPGLHGSLVLRKIEHHAVFHDDLIVEFVPKSMSLGELSTALLNLELYGKIRQLPGRMYSLKI